MNTLSVLGLSTGFDAANAFVGITVLNRLGVAVRLGLPYGIAVFILCVCAQTGFAIRMHAVEETVAFIALTGCLGASVFTDVATGYVLDVITLPSLMAALFMAAFEGRVAQVFEGALCVSSALLLLYGLSRGRGIGLGDAKLAACVGALLGIKDGFIALGIAFVLGGTYATILLLGKRAERKQSLPFAPYIAAGVFAVLSLRSV